MNKEQLLALGLTEEQATAVVSNLENGNMIPKARFDEVNNAKKALEAQVTDYSAQLKTLQGSAKGNEELEAKIKELQDAQSQAKSQYEQQLKDERISAAIKMELAGKVHDVDLVSGLIDKNSITVDESGKVTGGLTEQFTAMKESKSFLFIPETNTTTAPSFKGVQPALGSNEPPAPLGTGSTFAQLMNNSDPGKSVASDPWAAQV